MYSIDRPPFGIYHLPPLAGIKEPDGWMEGGGREEYGGLPVKFLRSCTHALTLASWYEHSQSEWSGVPIISFHDCMMYVCTKLVFCFAIIS